MVTQDGHLFHESIASNLRLARPDASEELMWDVLRQARLEDMIRSLPDGLDTVVGERGYRLSGGERQRLTIARLLIAQPRVVILDEATAALDSTNEAAVQEALGAALEGRTAVVIAHRLSTIRAADAILVVEGGVDSGARHAQRAARRRRPLRGAVPHAVRRGHRGGGRRGSGVLVRSGHGGTAEERQHMVREQRRQIVRAVQRRGPASGSRRSRPRHARSRSRAQ